MDLRGKRVVITGASSGIGWELLKRLNKAGANIVGVARNPQRIIDEMGQFGVKAISCDISEPANVDQMLKKAEEMLGGIDIFVANAGFAYYGKIGKADWDKNEKIFKTNVLSPIYTLQKLTEEGSIKPLTFMVTISALGKMVLPGYALYDSTKFALDGFVRTYRMEKPNNVRIIPVYPVANYTQFFKIAGGDDTPMPMIARQSPKVTAFCMEFALRTGLRAVYPSIVFFVRSILARVLPIDLIVHFPERFRFSGWIKRHEKSSE